MSEQLLIDQLDEAIDAIVALAASGGTHVTADERVVDRVWPRLRAELRLLPREDFKTSS